TPETPAQVPTATGKSITKSINLKLNKLSEKEMKALANANHYDKATGIDLRDSKDKYLPWYVKVVVKDAKLTDRQQKKALEVLGDNSKILKTYDIKLVNTQDKKVWKPTGIVNVKIPVPEGVDAEKLVMIHIAGNGRIEFVSGKISEDNKYFAIDTTDFSVFALVSADSSVAKLLKAEEAAEVNTLPWIIGACGALAIALIMLLIRRRMTAEK
ncbi:MAG: hypothetical protein HUJ79_06725, partial [Firmicutes bacterium]|nr:hypothetical protein [Bacillota bacterium]